MAEENAVPMETLGLEEAAAQLHMTVARVRRLASEGRITGCKPGKRWVFLREWIDEYATKRFAPRVYKDPRRMAQDAARRTELRPRRAEYFSWHRASKARRTPAWCDRRAVRMFYQIARRVTDCTGIPHTVDHFYPLHGQAVSGLHVPENLRVLPRYLNQSKGNSF